MALCLNVGLQLLRQHPITSIPDTLRQMVYLNAHAQTRIVVIDNV